MEPHIKGQFSWPCTSINQNQVAQNFHEAASNPVFAKNKDLLSFNTVYKTVLDVNQDVPKCCHYCFALQTVQMTTFNLKWMPELRGYNKVHEKLMKIFIILSGCFAENIFAKKSETMSFTHNSPPTPASQHRWVLKRVTRAILGNQTAWKFQSGVKNKKNVLNYFWPQSRPKIQTIKTHGFQKLVSVKESLSVLLWVAEGSLSGQTTVQHPLIL